MAAMRRSPNRHRGPVRNVIFLPISNLNVAFYLRITGYRVCRKWIVGRDLRATTAVRIEVLHICLKSREKRRVRKFTKNPAPSPLFPGSARDARFPGYPHSPFHGKFPGPPPPSGILPARLRRRALTATSTGRNMIPGWLAHGFARSFLVNLPIRGKNRALGVIPLLVIIAGM